MKEFAIKVWGYIFGILKDDPTDVKLSIGRLSFVAVMALSFGVWLRGGDIPEGLLSVILALMAYVIGSKAISKISDIATVLSEAKALRQSGVTATSTKPAAAPVATYSKVKLG